MRLGSFWGLPAPAIVVVFDHDRDFLYKCLDKLNTDCNARIVQDVRKEFLVLRQVAKGCSYELPEYDKVSTQYNEMKVVTKGKIEGANDLFTASLVNEVLFSTIEELVKRSGKGKYYKVDKLREAVQQTVEEETFAIGKIGKLPSKVLKKLESANRSTLPVLVKQFGLVEAPPVAISFGGEKVRLGEPEKKVWGYYHQRLDFIDEILARCITGRVAEEVTFGVPFFDMTKRKPASLKYKVIEIFDKAKDYRTSHLIGKCKAECAAELDRFKACLKKYVLEGDEGLDVLSDREFYQVVAQDGMENYRFFEKLAREREMVPSDYQQEDVEMLIEIRKLVLANQNWDEAIGVPNSAEVARRIGICGLSEHSERLFREAIVGTSLVHQGKITKDAEYLEEIQEVVSDVEALLDTLIPVGEEI